MNRLISEKQVLEAIDNLKANFTCYDFVTLDEVASHVKAIPSAETQIGHWKDFAVWVANEIFDDEWEYNKDAFAEIACRKLNKLGIVKAKGDEWELVEPYDGMTNGEVIKAVFPHEDVYKGEFGYDLGGCTIDFDWWNSPYSEKGSDKE